MREEEVEVERDNEKEREREEEEKEREGELTLFENDNIVELMLKPAQFGFSIFFRLFTFWSAEQS